MNFQKEPSRLFIIAHLLLSIFLTVVLSTACSSNSTTSKEKEKEQAEIYYAHGTSHLLKKNYTEAVSFLLQADKLSPEDSKIKNNLGMSYYFKGQEILAIETLHRAIVLDSSNSDARVNLAGIYLEAGKLLKAKMEYQLVLGDMLYQQQYRVYYNLGLIALKEGNSSLATKNFLTAIREKDDYCPAHYELGLMAKERGELETALKHFQDGIKSVCFEQSAIHYQLALTLKALNRKKLAADKLRFLLQKFPNDPLIPSAKILLRELHSENDNEELAEISKLKDRFDEEKFNKKLMSPSHNAKSDPANEPIDQYEVKDF